MGQDLLEALAVGDVRVVGPAAGGAAAGGEELGLLVLAQRLRVEGGQLVGVRGLAQLLQVVLVVELLTGQVELAAHRWFLSLISSSMSSRAVVSGR